MQTEKRRKKYQVFTPIDTVNKMLDEIGYLGSAILDKTIVDISCGDGAFLVEALRRLVKACKDSHIEDVKIPSLAIKNIFGCENDKSFYHKCQQNMSDLLNKELSTNKHYRFKNIKLMDGLTINDVCFDFVVGNPPYLSYKEMDEGQREFLQTNFRSCKKWKYDYSYAFIEKSLEICKNDGVVCIISPINMYRIKSGRLIREYLKNKLFRITDVTEENIFPRVLTNPVISFFKQGDNKGVIEYIKKDLKKEITVDSFYENTYDKKPNLLSGERRFGDYYSVNNGVATLYNAAFIVGPDCDAEEGILKNACSPKEVRYETHNKIIYPYNVVDGKIEKYDEKTLKTKFPKAFKHLLSYKNRLLERDLGNNEWFEYGRSQALNNVLYRKLMIPAIFTKKINPVILNKGDVVYAGFYIVERDPTNHPLEEIEKILKSERFFNYIRQVGVKMNGSSYRYSVKDLENYRY